MKITHPDYILFADETGYNTSMKTDGNIAGTKYLIKKGTTPQCMASTMDHRFTVLPFTSGNGKAVLCVVIFQCSEAQQLPLTWTWGVDIHVTPIIDSAGQISFKQTMGTTSTSPPDHHAFFEVSTYLVKCISPKVVASHLKLWFPYWNHWIK